MKQVTKKVHTGNSGSSFSFSLEPTWKSTRVHSGRKYYRNKTVWVCRDSAAHDDPGYFRRQEEAARKRAEVEERQRAEKARQDAIRNAEIARVERLKKKIEDLALDYGEQASTKARAFQQLHQSDIYNEFKLRYQEKIQKVFEIESVDADQFANGLLGAIPTKQILAGSFSVSSDINEKILGQGEQIFSERWIAKERKYRHLARSLLIISILAGVLAGAHSGWLVIAVPAAIGSILSFSRSRKIVRLSKDVQVVAADLYIGFVSIFLGSIQSMLSQSIYMNEDGAKVIARNLFAGRQVTQDLDSSVGGAIAEPASEPIGKKVELALDDHNQKIIPPNAMSFKDLTREIFEAENFFDLACLLLMSDVAGADGKMSEDEMRFISGTVGVIQDRDSQLLMEFAKRKSHYKILIKLLNKRYPPTSVAIQELVNNLFYLAEADQRFEQKELDAIRRIALDLGMGENEFNDILQGVLRRHKEDVEDQGARIIDDIFDEIDFEDLQE